MSRATRHPLQPRTDHDGTSRRLAVLACKHAVRKTLQSDLGKAFEQQGTTVVGDKRYRLWSGFNRASQDRMWSLLAEQIDDDDARIASAASQTDNKGSLRLQTDFSCPDYQYDAPIHGQPGGYMLDRDDDDLAAGVLYEAGGNLYAMGQGVGHRDSKGQRLIALIKEHRPDFRPKRILELGCSAGGQTTDYPVAFPEAEMHALDLSPAMLRYAHARARALGVTIHFHQLDAAATDFPEEHFDLILSHNLFHEVAADHMPAIMKECHRLLRPGGLCVHQDVPIQTARLDPFTRFLSEWQTENNDEPFWLDFANADLPKMMHRAGFDSPNVEYIEAIDGPIPWYVVSAER